MDTTYKMYCMGSVLIDKAGSYISNESSLNDKAVRITPNNRGLLGSLYDLTYPSTEIVPNLYLGNSCNARDYYDLEKKNVGLIVNSSPCISNYFPDYFEYYNVDVKDISGADILSHLDKTVTKMNDFLTKNKDKGIFVHCFMGSSRSATIVIAYLIKYQNYRVRDAINYVKEKRCVVNLNVDFFNQLIEFSREK